MSSRLFAQSDPKEIARSLERSAAAQQAAQELTLPFGTVDADVRHPGSSLPARQRRVLDLAKGALRARAHHSDERMQRKGRHITDMRDRHG